MSVNRMIGAALVAAVQCMILVNCHADDGEMARDLLMAVDVALRKDASLAESEEGTGIRSGLASRLREADPKSRDYNQQNWLVGVVGDFVRWDVFLRLRHLPEDAWKIRFAELAWERDYIDRRVASAPEDKRSPGQKAGLEFITLEDLIVFALTDGSGYEKFDISDGDEAYSIYAGVDREIYETNAVGLTSDALRSGKTGVDDIESPQRSLALSVWSKVLIGLSAASAVGLGASIAYAATISHAKNAIVPKLEAALAKWKDPHFTSDVIYHIDQLDDAIGGFQKDIVDCNRWIRNWQNKTPFGNNTAVNYSMDAEMDWMCMSAEQEAAVRAEFAETQAQEIAKYKDKITELNTRINDYTNEMDSLKQELNEVKGTIKKGEQLADRSSFSKKLMIGSTIMTIIIIGVTIYMIYRDFAAMKAKYKVDFTPAPKFIVEEKDLFTYNSYGDRVIVKNQAIYYKAAPTNRATNAEYYKMLGEVADLNGDVGKQWLALYVEHNEVNDPILADSFKVTSTEQIPSGYDTGIHMFGSTAAENLNNPLYVWNQTAPKVYVYYKLDDGAAASGGASVAGSNFSAGTLAMGALGGAVIGILITMFGMTKLGKKKKEAAA